ncbi:50S ribosomal protein L7/L12 [Carnobacterium mobile]|uniref:50S ribosomal protein L7/L12 n=1 Tax=Carnobacterium mobile TaxID=2750 RepID=UPI001866C246|nr:50S ribosomal protein L7/L12 [Carnobacterium mobile]
MNNIVIFSLIATLLVIIISLASSISQLKIDIYQMKKKLNTISTYINLPDPIDNELKTILLELISKGEKIKAVKEYRLATGAGLLEAKQYVDHLRK